MMVCNFSFVLFNFTRAFTSLIPKFSEMSLWFIPSKNKKIRAFFTYYKTRFVFQLLYKNAEQYLQFLKYIDKASSRVEKDLHKSMKNKELIQLLKLQKSLVYFSTSLSRRFSTSFSRGHTSSLSTTFRRDPSGTEASGPIASLRRAVSL